MQIKKSLKALKQAKQSRSRATCKAILDTAAHILKQQPNRLNTNEIAEVAGVSIGSLYQYFPNKGAILAELTEREFQIDLGILKNMAKKYSGKSLRTIFKVYLKTASKITHREFTLKQLLNARLNELDKVQCASKLQVEFIEILSVLLCSASDWPSNKDANIVAFICFTVTSNTYWMANQFSQYSHDELETELLAMFFNYVQKN